MGCLEILAQIPTHQKMGFFKKMFYKFWGMCASLNVFLAQVSVVQDIRGLMGVVGVTGMLSFLHSIEKNPIAQKTYVQKIEQNFEF